MIDLNRICFIIVHECFAVIQIIEINFNVHFLAIDIDRGAHGIVQVIASI